MRAAIVLFFSIFLPLISLFSTLFLFAEVTLKVHQLIYYYQRPTPSLHHDPGLLTWRKEMFMFLAIPFVVFYFITVTLKMTTCKQAVVRPIRFGSLGIYHCVDPDPEAETMGDAMDPQRMLLGMVLIPVMLLNYRLVKHCVRPKPECVRTLLAKRASRKQIKLENVKLSQLLSPALRTHLSDLFDTLMDRQRVKKRLLEVCMQTLNADGNDKTDGATKLQTLRKTIDGCEAEGAGETWPEVKLARGICDRTEAYSQVLPILSRT